MSIEIQIAIIIVAIFLIVLFSIQYTLNKILVILKEIKNIMLITREKKE